MARPASSRHPPLPCGNAAPLLPIGRYRTGPRRLTRNTSQDRRSLASALPCRPSTSLAVAAKDVLSAGRGTERPAPALRQARELTILSSARLAGVGPRANCQISPRPEAGAKSGSGTLPVLRGCRASVPPRPTPRRQFENRMGSGSSCCAASVQPRLLVATAATSFLLEQHRDDGVDPG